MGRGSELKLKETANEEILANPNKLKSPEPPELHSRVLKELTKVIAEPLSINFEKSRRKAEIPEDWWMINVIAISKKKEEVGSRKTKALTLRSRLSSPNSFS